MHSVSPIQMWVHPGIRAASAGNFLWKSAGHCKVARYLGGQFYPNCRPFLHFNAKRADYRVFIAIQPTHPQTPVDTTRKVSESLQPREKEIVYLASFSAAGMLNGRLKFAENSKTSLTVIVARCVSVCWQ